MRVLHVDDHHQPGLWLADATVWAFQRALHRDEPHWWNRVSGVATVTDVDTGQQISLESNRAAPPLGDRDPQNLSQSAQASLLTTKSYTLSAGSANRQQGPSPTYQNMLRKLSDAEHRSSPQQLSDRIAALGQRITALGDAVTSAAAPHAHSQPEHATSQIEVSDLRSDSEVPTEAGKVDIRDDTGPDVEYE